MGIISDIIEGMRKAEFKPVGLVLGKSAIPALDAGLKYKGETIRKHGSAAVRALMSLERSRTREFDGWDLVLDSGSENPYAKSDITVA